MQEKAFISIKRKNFEKKNRIFSFILFSMLFLLGLAGACLDWKNGLAAAGLVVFLYGIKKLTTISFSVLAGTGAVAIAALANLLQLEWWLLLFTMSLLSLAFFLVPDFKEISS